MAGAVDMPSALKLQVWSALIVLSSAFPACPEVHHTMSLLINLLYYMHMLTSFHCDPLCRR